MHTKHTKALNVLPRTQIHNNNASYGAYINALDRWMDKNLNDLAHRMILGIEHRVTEWFVLWKLQTGNHKGDACPHFLVNLILF